MIKYTTGEMAKLCGVTVRTVQYYDSRNILVPSKLSEGGRRLYSEDDLKRLKIICFLREIGLSIDSIRNLLKEEQPEAVIAILLEEQEKSLKTEILERQEKLRLVNGMQSELKRIEHFTVDSIGDMANIMRNREKRNQMIRRMFIVGIVMDLIEVMSVIYGFQTGNWWPLIVGLFVIVGLGVSVSRYYYKYTAFICPECHEIFKAPFLEMFWAYHTPRVRELTCPRCNHTGLCVEIYDEG